MDDPSWFLDEFWWALISFPLFLEGLKDFVGFLVALAPWCQWSRGLAFSLVVLEQIAQAVEPAKHGIVRRIAREKREEALKKLQSVEI